MKRTRSTRDSSEKPQVISLLPALEYLPRHDHALDLVRPLVDLADRGPAGSFRRYMPCLVGWYQHGFSAGMTENGLLNGASPP